MLAPKCEYCATFSGTVFQQERTVLQEGKLVAKPIEPSYYQPLVDVLGAVKHQKPEQCANQYIPPKSGLDYVSEQFQSV